MFLYDKKDKTLEVYEFTANKADLIDYRISQMKQIPEDERIVYAETHVAPYGATLLFESHITNPCKDTILSSGYADNEDLKNNINNAYGRYHVLKNDNRSKRNNEILLDCYYYGHLKDRNIVQIQYLELIKYFLLSAKKYSYLGEYNGGKNYIMEEIIQLPESLYILQLLEQERFASLDGKNISEQLALFNLQKINELNIDEIQKMDACGITQDKYSKTINKANNDAHILKLIKK